MQYIQVKLGSLPVALVCMEDGTVLFVRIAKFKAFFDQSSVSGNVDAVFDINGFTIGTNTYQYDTSYAYKNDPAMLQWLKQQNLQSPF